MTTIEQMLFVDARACAGSIETRDGPADFAACVEAGAAMLPCDARLRPVLDEVIAEELLGELLRRIPGWSRRGEALLRLSEEHGAADVLCFGAWRHDPPQSEADLRRRLHVALRRLRAQHPQHRETVPEFSSLLDGELLRLVFTERSWRKVGSDR